MTWTTVRRGVTVASATAALALISLVAIKYGLRGPSSPEVRSVPTALEAKPPAGEGFRFTLLAEPRPMPDLRFADAEGRALTIGDFRGRLVLLNVWATWCGPCRREMPTLDRLQAKLGGPDFEVVALSIDRQGVPVVREFYRELALKALGIYVDQSGQVTRDLGIVGIPTTLLVDRKGNEIGRLVGASEWDSRKMISFLREQMTEANGPRASAAMKATSDQTLENDK